MSPDFDAVLEAAWRDFADTLAVRVPRLLPGQSLAIVEAAAGGWRRRMTFAVTGTLGSTERLRCTISAGDLTWTDKDRWMRQATYIVDRGWCRLEGRSAFCFEVDPLRFADLADAAVRALREVWGVIHPSFVSIGDPSFARHHSPLPADDLDAERDQARSSESSRVVGEDPDDTVRITDADTLRFTAPPRFVDAPAEGGVIPQSKDHLVELVRAAMTAAGRPAVVSPRKAIFLRSTGTSLLRPTRDARSLEIVTILSSSVPAPSLLGMVVAEFSPRWPEVAVVVRNGLVYAQRRIDVAVFSPANLDAALRRWDDFARSARGDMIRRLGSQPKLDHRGRGDRLPGALLSLLRVNQKLDNKLSPTTVLAACHRDRERVHEFFDICAAEMREWMDNLTTARNAELGDEEIALCEAEHQAYARVARLLLSAMDLADGASGPSQRPPAP
ncbi:MULTISPECIES: hypothetical protein [Gordonia]|uniref:YbjN domain-containing protein n=1 Tax=Gordonia terrae TaxID=2055 RepID=A0A2I1R1W8_9ACTN|nr:MULTISPECIES: hypothetical protein [Gordonia]MCG7634542.1 hypothetical protein [Gordonia sp. McavH-238-E]MCX2755092.1 hypothetical protein [Gordonia sp. 4N]PKZ63107.1 hypothetical protein CYJ73_23665 [Gordonia terrae]UPW09443.1 hypothetical protein M1C59_00800 [Gordonia terrae]